MAYPRLRGQSRSPSDGRDFGSVRMPTKETTRNGDDISVFTIASVTWDDVPDSVFELPTAVRAKLKN